MKDPTLIIMAAGIGHRYGGLKQVDPVGPSGELIIDYSIYDAIKAGFGKVVFVIRRQMENIFRQKVIKHLENKVQTACVFQELNSLPTGFKLPGGREKPWGTAHAVLACRNEVSSPFALINSDDFYGTSSFQTLGAYLKNAREGESLSEHCLVGFTLKNTLSEFGSVSRGCCRVSRGGYLEDIRERLKVIKSGDGAKYAEDNGNWVEISPRTVVSTNMWGFTPSIFARLEEGFIRFLKKNIGNPGAEYLIPGVVDELIKEKKARVKVLPTDERWLGVTYPEDKPAIQQAIREMVEGGLYPLCLWD